MAEAVIDAITAKAKTGQIGGGKIFVTLHTANPSCASAPAKRTATRSWGNFHSLPQLSIKGA